MIIKNVAFQGLEVAEISHNFGNIVIFGPLNFSCWSVKRQGSYGLNGVSLSCSGRPSSLFENGSRHASFSVAKQVKF